MTLTRQQQIIFDRYSEMKDRPSGSAVATEYKRGLDGKRSLAPTDSLAYAAYLAGKVLHDQRRDPSLGGRLQIDPAA